MTIVRTVEEKKAKKRESNRKYRETHREQKREYEHQYCQTHREQTRERKRKWYAANKERIHEYSYRWCKEHHRQRQSVYLKHKYGITIQEYERILAEQDGVCAICKVNPKKNPLCVDHNHSTREIRGLLCVKCNLGLGYLDNPEWMHKAIEYKNKKEVETDERI